MDVKSTSASSITTRIKTLELQRLSYLFYIQYKCIIHYNKD